MTVTKSVFKKNFWFKFSIIFICLCLLTGCSDEDNSAGLYIPAIELPETGDGADMFGTVVYSGDVYTGGMRYVDGEIKQVEHLIGDYLGITSGSINIGADRSENTEKIASNLHGVVYTVKGYDPDFMICVRSDESVNADFLWFLYRLNDITVENGEDLFEDRLHMRDNIESIQWQSHEDWNFEKDNLQDVSIKKTVWKQFLHELYKGEFMLTYKSDKNHPLEGFYEDIPSSSLFLTPNQTHLYINLNDGLVVELRLCEGGYVGVFSFAWDYCVYMPCEAFDVVYELCGGLHEPGWVVAE